MDLEIIKAKILEKEKLFLKKEIGCKREILQRIIKALNYPSAIVITGLRRVGKTTLLRQLFEHLNTETSNNIHFFSFDRKETRSVEFLEQLLEYLCKIGGDDKKKTFIFLDEIQYITDWQGTIKHYIDFYPDIKFVITGSSSLFIKKKMSDSLAGRTYELYVHPLNYNEYQKIFLNKDLPKFDVTSFLASQIKDIKQI